MVSKRNLGHFRKAMYVELHSMSVYPLFIGLEVKGSNSYGQVTMQMKRIMCMCIYLLVKTVYLIFKQYEPVYFLGEEYQDREPVYDLSGNQSIHNDSCPDGATLTFSDLCKSIALSLYLAVMFFLSNCLLVNMRLV